MFKVISEIIFPANLLTGAKHQKQNIVQQRTTKKNLNKQTMQQNYSYMHERN